VIEYRDEEVLPDRPEVLARLDSGDRDTLVAILRALCPCGNVCYDDEIWRAMVGLIDTSTEFVVREQARHALITLGERSRIDTRARDLLRRLAEEGGLGARIYPPWFQRQLHAVAVPKRVRYPKVSRRDVPTFIEELSSDDPIEQRDAMSALCPTDGRNPNRKVWGEILAGRGAWDVRLRAKADAAARRLVAHSGDCPRKHPFAAGPR
jgi:hypothetical protein